LTGVRRGLLIIFACLAVLLMLGVPAPAQQGSKPRWRVLHSVPGAVDVVGPRSDGRFIVSSRGGLVLFRRGGAARPFARGPAGYAPAGGEPYVALSQGRRLRRQDCSFRRDEVFALDAAGQPGVTRIGPRGRARRFASFPAGAFPSGITFDGVGRFGNRLLVTAVFGQATTTVYAIDCRGRVRAISRGGPRVEGGIEVAPQSFGRFGGQLIAPDEHSGRVFAFDARGRRRLMIAPRLPSGGDIGVESVGFVPPGFGRRGRAYLADLGAPGAPTAGTDSVLTLSGASLTRAGVRPGDLLVAREAGAETIRVRCRRRCSARRVATGPSAAHAEGHITFAPRR